MSDTTTEILNDTTSVQSRIDTVLSAADNELDWANDSGWHPGDPLYVRPDGGYVGEQVIRPMIQLHGEDSGHHLLMVTCDCGCAEGWSRQSWYPTCATCEVSWSGPEPCWVCGAPRPRSVEVAVNVTATPFADRMEAMFRDAARSALARTREEMLERGRSRFAGLPSSSRVMVGFDGSRDTEAVVFAASPGAMWFVPGVANPAAPTMAELTAAMAVSTGLQLDGYQRAFIDAWFGEPSPVGTHTSPSWPSPLPIDGNAYRRRTKRRRR